MTLLEKYRLYIGNIQIKWQNISFKYYTNIVNVHTPNIREIFHDSIGYDTAIILLIQQCFFFFKYKINRSSIRHKALKNVTCPSSFLACQNHKKIAKESGFCSEIPLENI